MEFKPLNERVLVKPSEAEEKTAGGIYIPESAKEKSQEGTIVAVADKGCESLKVGDKVVYENFAGADINLDGKKHIILKIKDVLGIIK
ncbi:MAG: co-chaperone GroES [Nanoarchaeota archaeon]|nr:co-chaperone GroES [Nanoarchaeota archaeon]